MRGETWRQLKMKFVKEKFLRSEFGTAMQECIADWDKHLSEGDETAGALAVLR